MKKSKPNLIDYAVNATKAAYNNKCHFALEHKSCFSVVPVRHLSLNWLLENNGWPLGRYTQSAGQFASNKSCFIFWLAKLYLDRGGIALIIDTENKLSVPLLQSIVGDTYFDPDNEGSRRLLILNAASVNEWQRMLTTQLQILKDYKAEHGDMPNVPILWAVDSMTGAGSEGMLEQIYEQGEAAGRSFPESALLIAQYMQSFTAMLSEWPVTIHCSRHEKPNLGTVGSHSLGGHAPDFYASYDLRFKKGGATWMGKQSEYIKGDVKAKAVTISIRKSAFGSDIEKSLTTLFCWKYVNDKQVSWWDWDGSTAMLLATYASKIKEALNISINHVPKQGTRSTIGGEYFWSDELDIPQNKAIPAPEFGALIEQSSIRPELAKLLEVKNNPEI